MNTDLKAEREKRQVRSDSSMVDEYHPLKPWLNYLKSVQIPLWSMNTWTVAELEKRFQSSDSSMVDEYAERSKAKY